MIKRNKVVHMGHLCVFVLLWYELVLSAVLSATIFKHNNELDEACNLQLDSSQTHRHTDVAAGGHISMSLCGKNQVKVNFTKRGSSAPETLFIIDQAFGDGETRRGVTATVQNDTVVLSNLREDGLFTIFDSNRELHKMSVTITGSAHKSTEVVVPAGGNISLCSLDQVQVTVVNDTVLLSNLRGNGLFTVDSKTGRLCVVNATITKTGDRNVEHQFPDDSVKDSVPSYWVWWSTAFNIVFIINAVYVCRHWLWSKIQTWKKHVTERLGRHDSQQDGEGEEREGAAPLKRPPLEEP